MFSMKAMNSEAPPNIVVDVDSPHLINQIIFVNGSMAAIETNNTCDRSSRSIKQFDPIEYRRATTSCSRGTYR